MRVLGIVGVLEGQEAWTAFVGPALGLAVGTATTLATEAGGVEVGGASVIAKHDAFIDSEIVGVVTGGTGGLGEGSRTGTWARTWYGARNMGMRCRLRKSTNHCGSVRAQRHRCWRAI